MSDLYQDTGKVSATTTASMVTVPLSAMELDLIGTGGLAITCLNTGGTNAASWQVVASNDDFTADADPTALVVVKAAAPIAHGATDSYAVDHSHFRWYAVQVADGSSGSHTTVQVHGFTRN